MIVKVAYYTNNYTKRKRGRPRGIFDMSEFDVNLIREFERRPGFYDRNSPHFKDKIYNAQAWQEISNNLGYDVALLKDRMLQLRNRYNLEKRRLENLAEEYPTKVIQSQWPLYDHLHFLSTHIRPRRSYKRMLTRPSTEFRSLSNPSSSSGTANSQTNGMVTVKIENGNDGDSEGASNPDETELDFEGINSMFTDNDIRPEGAPPPKQISVRNLDCMRTIIPKNNIRLLNPDPVVPEKRVRLESTRIQKYDAFGKFMTSSLLEMPPERALLLVEKFTSDLVKALIEKHHSQNGNQKEAVDVSDDEVH